MKIVERFEASGHVNVRATHPTTIEVTRDPLLSLRGGCIVAVNSTKGAGDLSEAFKKAAKSLGARITLVIELDGESFSVSGYGSPQLTFLDPKDMVVRKSQFISDRTIMISADKASVDIPRKMVKRLKDPATRVLIRLEVEI